MKRVQLVLGAGGTRCFSYVGAIEALEKRGWTFSTVSGVSAGAVVGVLVASGRSGAEIAALVRDRYPISGLRNPRRVPILRRLVWPYSVFAESLPRELVRALLGGGDPTLAELPKPFASIGLDLVTGRLFVYGRRSDPEMKVSEIIAIATAAPGLYPPYRKGPRLLIDGALASECPLWLAGSHESLDPVLALKTATSAEWSHPKNVLDYWTRAVRGGIQGRDAAMASAFGNSAELTIEVPSTVKEEDFRVAKEDRELLIDEGRRQMEACLERGELDFGQGRPLAEPSRDSSDAARRFLSLATPRDTVFVSYSRRDAAVRDELIGALQEHAPHLPSLQLWADTEIGVGAEWYGEIIRAMHRTRVAVLLVSQVFLASRFIGTRERPFFIDAAAAGVLKVIWLNLDIPDPSQIPEDISRFQGLNEGRMLPTDPDARNEVWRALVRGVERAFEWQRESGPEDLDQPLAAVRAAAEGTSSP